MSNQELDKLFKNKLEDLKVQPSADAWSKIQKKTKNERSPWLFIRVAAALVILAVFAGIIWINVGDQPQNNNTVAINDNAGAKKKENTQNKETKTDGESHDLVKGDKIKEQHGTKPSNPEPMHKDSEFTEKLVLAKENKEDRKAQSVTKKESASRQPANNSRLPETTGKETKNQDAETKNQNLGTSNQKPETRNQEQETRNQKPETSDPKPETRTLTFNIEQFASAKIPDNEQESQAVLADAGSPEKNTIKKVINFAQDLKEGSGGLGELREVKNELFAFNFKNRNENSN